MSDMEENPASSRLPADVSRPATAFSVAGGGMAEDSVPDDGGDPTEEPAADDVGDPANYFEAEAHADHFEAEAEEDLQHQDALSTSPQGDINKTDDSPGSDDITEHPSISGGGDAAEPEPAGGGDSRPGTATVRPASAAAEPAPPSRPATSRPPYSGGAGSRPGSVIAAGASRVGTATARATPPASGPMTPPKEVEKQKSLDEPLKEESEEEFEFQGENIWIIAEKMNQARILRGINLSENQSVETTLLFVGGKQAGKSSMIHKFLDREEEPKKTLGLEYSYGRKAGKSVLKDVCHIWELGGGTTYTPLLETPLKAERLPSIAIFLVIDLTQLDGMWITLETMINTLREGLEAEISSPIGREMKLKERLKEATDLRVPPDHQDYAQLRPFPVPLVIVGGRYDLFQDWDPEKKKLICRTLRYVAHVNGAALQFFSSADSALVKKAKDLMGQLAFGGTVSSGHLAQDYNKPLLIPPGADSLAGILGVGADTSYSAVKNAFIAQYPQDAQGTTALPEDPAKDLSYRESEIDQLRAQKDQELERLRRELERRRKWGEEL